MKAKKILFLVTEDWFFHSHFMPLARRASEGGYEVVVAARDTGALSGEGGLRVVPMPFTRRSRGIVEQAAWVRALVASENPDIVHAIALKPIVLLILACVRKPGRVFALTGGGHAAVSRKVSARIFAWCFRRLLRSALDRPRTILLVENKRDRDWVEAGRPLPAERTFLMPGAGVDVSTFSVSDEPQGPIIVGIVCRLIRSKGVDVAVDAVSQLRSTGLDIRLRVAGRPDPENPDHVMEKVIAQWRATPGVELIGRTNDVNAFWARVHIACLASRGGEGLPRTLLEAAACGRPFVTTDTPGCADFANEAGGGFVVAPDVASELAEALLKLAKNSAGRRAMGAAARAQILAGYTEAHAGAVASRAWASAERA